MRALFLEYSEKLKSGTYIFVAKVAINDIDHKRFQKDFSKVLSRLKTIKDDV
jgi:ribonuclease P protein component